MSVPYTCPICNGRGLVPHDFYEIGTPGPSTTCVPFSVDCRSCGGRGVITEPATIFVEYHPTYEVRAS